MTLSASLPAIGSLASGIVSLGLIAYLWPYRGKPGGRFFVATIAAEALWALAYGAALLVFDPALRRLFEVPIWLGVNFIGVFFLAFALEYTGRGELVRSTWLGAIVVLQAVHTAIVATNGLHHIAWSDYAVEPAFGAATVTYTHQPWLFVNCVGMVLLVAAGVFLLLDTFFSYGTLYRKQAVAVALSPVLPGLAFLLWLFEVGEAYPLNLTTLTFPVHLAFDAYAFLGRDMFEVTPAARRVGERAAIDDLGSAVVILNADRRIVDGNAEACRVFSVNADEMLGRPIDVYLGDVDLDAGGETVSLVAGTERREYAITPSAFEDSSGSIAGYTVVLQDVTVERRRQQRLSVLNRVLRHNLRNDLNVVRGHVEMASDEVEGSVAESLERARRKTDEVIELGEKARTIERALDTGDDDAGGVKLRPTVERIVADLGSDGEQPAITIDVPADLEIRGSARLVEGVFRSLVENAVHHNEEGRPSVVVEVLDVDRGSAVARIAVRDDGPGIPNQELAAIEHGDESALEHGSGLGLWLVSWGVSSLGGDVEFRTGESGTTVVLALPTTDSESRGGSSESAPSARGGPDPLRRPD